MDKRGQILSLDYVISLMLVLLAIGLLLNFSELQTVNAKETQLRSELEALADGAARLALTSPGIACRLESLDGFKDIGVLPNCIPKGDRVTRQNMGIPTGFECAIVTDPPNLFTATSCFDKSPDGKDYYSVTRKIVAKTDGDPKITKKQLQDCAESTELCTTLTDANMTISIWRT